MKSPKTFLQKVDELILSNLTHEDMLGLLSEQLHLSNSQIHLNIKQETGCSPSIYVHQKRLAVAYDWLQTTDLPVSEIARLVGFHQVAYFSWCFSKRYGISP